MHRTDPRTAGSASSEIAHAAFRDLHGRRLHGFALLLTLGDRAVAASLATDALNAAAPRLAELRHPERAAAWLRARCLQQSRRPARSARAGAAGRRVLEDLGVDGPTFNGLAALDRRDRAALIAASIERLDLRDVAVVIGRDGGQLDRTLSRARRRYAAAFAAAAPPELPAGPTVDRIRATAQRAMT